MVKNSASTHSIQRGRPLLRTVRCADRFGDTTRPYCSGGCVVRASPKKVIAVVGGRRLQRDPADRSNPPGGGVDMQATRTEALIIKYASGGTGMASTGSSEQLAMRSGFVVEASPAHRCVWWEATTSRVRWASSPMTGLAAVLRSRLGSPPRLCV